VPAAPGANMYLLVRVVTGGFQRAAAVSRLETFAFHFEPEFVFLIFVESITDFRVPYHRCRLFFTV